MSEKITLSTLRKRIAQQAAVSEQKAGEFLNAIFPTITEGLKTEGQVKINGLGVFRLQSIGARRSVNIQTGETITIEGYNRVVFSPETATREKVNKPYANLEVKVMSEDGTFVSATKAETPANDPIKRLGEQAEEIKDIIAGFSTLNEGNTQIEEKEGNTQIEEKEGNTQIEEKEENTQTEENMKTEETTVVEPIPIEQETVSIAEGSDGYIDNLEESTDGKKRVGLWISLIVILVFCLILIFCYFFLQNKLTDWANGILNKGQEVTTEQMVTEPAEATLTEEYSLPERVYDEFITTEKLTNGSRLAWLSRKYYGAPDFWVYIYEANKDRIQNPNLIVKGTKVRVPKLPSELIDTNNEAAMQQAHQLHEQYKDIR